MSRGSLNSPKAAPRCSESIKFTESLLLILQYQAHPENQAGIRRVFPTPIHELSQVFYTVFGFLPENLVLVYLSSQNSPGYAYLSILLRLS